MLCWLLVGVRLGALSADEDGSSSFSLSVYRRLKSGDVVGDFQLVHHLDYLGLVRPHASDDYVPSLQYSDTEGYPLPLLPGRPEMNVLALQERDQLDSDPTCRRGEYCLHRNIFLGGHGELWRAHRILSHDSLDLNTTFILKRMRIRNRHDIKNCAEREIFFGTFLQGSTLFSRFETYFADENDYWLVFRDEGISLNNLLYASINKDMNPVLQPSQFWRRMRTTPLGKSTMKGILHQLIKGIASLHSHRILHRDIKPSNVLVNTETLPRLVIADFSSSVSTEAVERGLYDPLGPTVMEETPEYSPPEVLLTEQNRIPYDAQHPYSYDAWSVGVVFLELILGTNDVFSVDQRTSAMIHFKLRGADERQINAGKVSIFTSLQSEFLVALLHAAWAEYCIFDHHLQVEDALTVHYNLTDLHPLAHVSEPIKCGLTGLSKAILRRDPLGIGFDEYWGLDLLSRLLRWNPADRISMLSAFKHAYFTGPYVSDIDGSEHGTEEDLTNHNMELFTNEGYVYEEPMDSVVALSGDVHGISLNENQDSSVEMFAITESLETTVRRVVLKVIDEMEFKCPLCGRSFTEWSSCHAHLTARRHGVRCIYNSSL